MRGFFAADTESLGLVVDHHKDAEEIHERRKDGHQHDLGVGDAGELRHDEAARPHDGRHEHTADGCGRLDTARHMGAEARLLHHGDGKGAGGHRIGDGAARDGAEQPAGDDGHLSRSADLVAHRGQREIDEKALGAARFEKRPEDHEQDHVGGQHVGHDPEHAVALIENAGT